eukprot:CAMPEP_0194391430 /NCGR_PEP_ID=MMETSP0174-20130528/115548_1 /TAXON_ID=216777 /ORGANISM="Proboscia alata, Strain PI-D3" /LENGTH=404 /DNA_ID=CAMNT_0039185737 /DNA_START=37 /DNA_END=1251 /DNA_ORIENTATION=+
MLNLSLDSVGNSSEESRALQVLHNSIIFHEKSASCTDSDSENEYSNESIIFENVSQVDNSFQEAKSQNEDAVVSDRFSFARWQKKHPGPLILLMFAVAVFLGVVGSYDTKPFGASDLPLSNNNTISDVGGSLVQYKTIIDIEDFAKRDTSIPVFWRIPQSEGQTIEWVLIHCIGLVAAGIGNGHSLLSALEIRGGGGVTNVDIESREQNSRDKHLRIIESGIVDVVYSPDIHVTSEIFSLSTPGVMFTIFKHPIERSIEVFHLLQKKDAVFAEMTIDDYARSEHAERNWMTRTLLGKWDSDLTSSDLENAKQILRRKCLIGLSDDIGAALMRFSSYFNWDIDDPTQSLCLRSKITEDIFYHKSYPLIKGSHTWESLKSLNEIDILLYEFAREEYNLQKESLSFD